MNTSADDKNHSRTIDLLLRVGALVWLLGWAWLILKPFLSILLWGLIISISINPLFLRIRKLFGGRNKLAAITITLLLLALILIPTLWLSGSILDSFENLKAIYASGDLVIPPPGDRVKNWPAIAKPIVDTWQLASENLVLAATKYKDELRTLVSAVIKGVVQTGLGVVQLIVSIIIAGVMLSYGKEGGEAAEKIFIKLAGSHGTKFVNVSEETIRGTVKGVLGVAFVQSLLAGGGLVVMDIPFAGLWFLACLLLAVLQIGVWPVLIPAVIYVFSSHDTLPASLFLVWSVFAMISDNILKPLLLGRNTSAPMLVVFLGCIGGFIADGFLGMFLGPVVLSLAYNLLISWMNPVIEPEPGN